METVAAPERVGIALELANTAPVVALEQKSLRSHSFGLSVNSTNRSIFSSLGDDIVSNPEIVETFDLFGTTSDSLGSNTVSASTTEEAFKVVGLAPVVEHPPSTSSSSSYNSTVISEPLSSNSITSQSSMVTSFKHPPTPKTFSTPDKDNKPQQQKSTEADVEMSSASHVSGVKRTAARDPSLTPDKTKCGSDGGMQPVALDSKFQASCPLTNLLKKAEANELLTLKEVRATLDHPDWEGDHAMHPNINRLLVSQEYFDEMPPAAPQIEDDYVFEEVKDKTTGALMKSLNFLTVESLLHARISNLRFPIHSPCHPSKGPFYLRRDPVRLDRIIVENSKEKICVEFSYKEHRLDTKSYKFDLNDAPTYHFLCQYGSLKVVALMESEYKANKPRLAPSGGLFSIKIDLNAPNFATIANDSGLIHELNVQDLDKLEGEWKTVGGTGAPSKSVSFDKDVKPGQATDTNYFASLSDDDDEKDEKEDMDTGSDGGVREEKPKSKQNKKKKRTRRTRSRTSTRQSSTCFSTPPPRTARKNQMTSRSHAKRSSIENRRGKQTRN